MCRRSVDTADRSEPGRGADNGWRISAPRQACRPGLAAARRSDGRGVGTAVVSIAGGRGRSCTHAAGLADDPPRAAAHGRDAVAAVGGVSGRSPRRLRLQPVLRALPALGGAADACHAPAPCRWREDIRRLRGGDAGGDRPEDRRDTPGAALRRRARGLELHLRRGELDAGIVGLDRLALPRLRLFWRRVRPDCLG